MCSLFSSFLSLTRRSVSLVTKPWDQKRMAKYQHVVTSRVFSSPSSETAFRQMASGRARRVILGCVWQWKEHWILGCLSVETHWSLCVVCTSKPLLFWRAFFGCMCIETAVVSFTSNTDEDTYRGFHCVAKAVSSFLHGATELWSTDLKQACMRLVDRSALSCILSSLLPQKESNIEPTHWLPCPWTCL